MADALPNRPDVASPPRPYEPPTLVEIGTLLDLTAGGTGPGPDPT